jgi:hypothetical protein
MSHLSLSTIQQSRRDNAGSVRLQRPWLLIARVVWVMIATLALSILIAGIPVYYNFLHAACRSIAACNVNGALTPEDKTCICFTGWVSLSMPTFSAWSC